MEKDAVVFPLCVPGIRFICVSFLDLMRGRKPAGAASSKHTHNTHSWPVPTLTFLLTHTHTHTHHTHTGLLICCCVVVLFRTTAHHRLKRPFAYYYCWRCYLLPKVSVCLCVCVCYADDLFHQRGANYATTSSLPSASVCV